MMKFSKKRTATAPAVTVVSFVCLAAALVFALCSSALFSSCKGRTMENMEPTGDTVEVVVETPQAAPADTIV